MADSGWVKVDGLAGVRQALTSLDQKVQKTILRKGLREGAKPLLAAIRADAPVRTGFLQSTLKIKGGGGRKGIVSVKVGTAFSWNKGKSKGKLWYADWVNDGHRVGKIGFVQGSHFMEKGTRAAAGSAIERAAQSWIEQIREAWKMQ